MSTPIKITYDRIVPVSPSPILAPSRDTSEYWSVEMEEYGFTEDYLFPIYPFPIGSFPTLNFTAEVSVENFVGIARIDATLYLWDAPYSVERLIKHLEVVDHISGFIFNFRPFQTRKYSIPFSIPSDLWRRVHEQYVEPPVPLWWLRTGPENIVDPWHTYGLFTSQVKITPLVRRGLTTQTLERVLFPNLVAEGTIQGTTCTVEGINGQVRCRASWDTMVEEFLLPPTP